MQLAGWLTGVFQEFFIDFKQFAVVVFFNFRNFYFPEHLLIFISVRTSMHNYLSMLEPVAFFDRLQRQALVDAFLFWCH